MIGETQVLHLESALERAFEKLLLQKSFARH